MAIEGNPHINVYKIYCLEYLVGLIHVNYRYVCVCPITHFIYMGRNFTRQAIQGIAKSGGAHTCN